MFLSKTTKPTKRNSFGFTLIELLVVVSIISLLSSVVLASVKQARAKSRDATRMAQLRQVQTALEMYRIDYSNYPSTSGQWFGISNNGGNRTTSGANAYIPGLTPSYMPELPVDPIRRINDWSGYLYQSDGTNYKLLIHQDGPESFPTNNPFFDPVRPGHAWMICSGEPACSTW